LIKFSFASAIKIFERAIWLNFVVLYGITFFQILKSWSIVIYSGNLISYFDLSDVDNSSYVVINLNSSLIGFLDYSEGVCFGSYIYSFSSSLPYPLSSSNSLSIILSVDVSARTTLFTIKFKTYSTYCITSTSSSN